MCLGPGRAGHRVPCPRAALPLSEGVPTNVLNRTHYDRVSMGTRGNRDAPPQGGECGSLTYHGSYSTGSGDLRFLLKTVVLKPSWCSVGHARFNCPVPRVGSLTQAHCRTPSTTPDSPRASAAEPQATDELTCFTTYH